MLVSQDYCHHYGACTSVCDFWRSRMMSNSKYLACVALCLTKCETSSSRPSRILGVPTGIAEGRVKTSLHFGQAAEGGYAATSGSFGVTISGFVPRSDPGTVEVQ